MVYIPGFLINKVYQRGSLKNTSTGFEFAFINRMTPLRISGMRDLRVQVDGVLYPNDKLELELGGQTIDLEGGGIQGTLDFSKGSKLIIRVKGGTLEQGRHVLKTSFITNEYGGATLKVTDHIGEGQSSSFLSRMVRWIGGGEKTKPAAEGPVQVEGELGGVPLDPDFSRLEAALRHEEPDRVPLFEAEIARPIQEWFLGREINSARDDVEFYIRAGYDYAPVLPPFFAPRLMRTAADTDGELDESDKERAWVKESEGLIKTQKDVEEFPWPKPEDVDFSSFHEIAALLPEKMKILGMLVPAAIFGNTSQSMGLQNFSYALYDNESLVASLFEILGSTYLKLTKKLVTMPRLGAVLMADDLAHTGGCLVSPKVYRQYVFPWYKRIGETLANAKIPFIFHSDGKLWEVLDDLAACGVRGIHPVEPLAMDIVDLKKRYGDRFCIFGNIDLEYTLTQGSCEEVVQLVKKRISQLAPGGGYALAASNSVPEYVKPENYRAMVEATKKYGKYPIGKA